MSIPVKLSEELVEKAKRMGAVYNRSTPRQIEYWAKLGRLAEENPDLPMHFIQDILTAREEIDTATPFEFG